MPHMLMKEEQDSVCARRVVHKYILPNYDESLKSTESDERILNWMGT